MKSSSHLLPAALKLSAGEEAGLPRISTLNTMTFQRPISNEF